MTLSVKGLRKSYGDILALEALDFDLVRGGSVALLGPNGSGKSTAVKMLVSLLAPDGGTMTWDGKSLLENPSEIRKRVGYVSQELAMDKMLTGVEFMRFCSGLLHIPWKKNRDRAMGLLEAMGLKEAEDRLIGEYSGGMKRRLDLAAALLNDPGILVLDEPTTGLDIEAKEMIWDLIADVMGKGSALILASHDFQEVQKLAQNILILEKGAVVCRDTANALKRNLGHLIIRIKTREYMEQHDFSQVRDLLDKQSLPIQWRDDDHFATLAYGGDASMSEMQSHIVSLFEGAGVGIHSLNIQEPDLEEVYRFAVGSAS